MIRLLHHLKLQHTFPLKREGMLHRVTRGVIKAHGETLVFQQMLLVPPRQHVVYVITHSMVVAMGRCKLDFGLAK